MIPCPVCNTEYDPRDGDCPSCGPIPLRPGMSPNTWAPDYSKPGVAARIAAEADYMERIRDPKGRRK